MAFNHRKMLVSCLHINDLNFCLHQYLPPPPPPQPPPPPPPPPQRELSLLLPTTIWVAGSILLFMFLVILLYLYLTQPRRTSAATVNPGDATRREETEERELSDFHHVWRIPTVGLHRSEINSITVVGFKKGEGLIDDTECSVCLNEFEEDESLRLLPKCSHAFHINCIDTWLHSHKNCPLCRAPVLPLSKPPHPHQETETNHHQPSSNDLSGGQQSSRSRNLHILTRAQSDMANHCGTGRVENVRRSSSIGGSLSLSDVNNIATRSGRQLYTSFSAANLFSSSRRSRNQEPVLPNRIPSVSNNTS